MPIPAPVTHADLPLVLAGPLLRRMEPQRLVLWLVGSQPLSLSLQLSHGDAPEPQHYPLPVDSERRAGVYPPDRSGVRHPAALRCADRLRPADRTARPGRTGHRRLGPAPAL